MSGRRMERRAQSAQEFVILAMFMLVVLAGFLLVIKQRGAMAAEEARQHELQAIGDAVILEVANANRANLGYSRTFELPLLINGEPYTMDLDSKTEIIVRTPQEEHMLFLPTNVTLNTSLGLQESGSLTPQQLTINKNASGIFFS